MTTEKCHSVCLLVYDIIFFSPKNKPCVLQKVQTSTPVWMMIHKNISETNIFMCIYILLLLHSAVFSHFRKKSWPTLISFSYSDHADNRTGGSQRSGLLKIRNSRRKSWCLSRLNYKLLLGSWKIQCILILGICPKIEGI